MPSKTLILEKQIFQQKVVRMAYQIAEDYADEKKLIVVGIKENGAILAKQLQKQLTKIADFDIKYCELSIDKDNYQKDVPTLTIDSKELKNTNVILVDDVINSGGTLIYGAKFLLEFPVRRLSTAVMVNRDHRRFPIKADYVGLSLATTMQEHIQVEFDKQGKGVAYLE